MTTLYQLTVKQPKQQTPPLQLAMPRPPSVGLSEPLLPSARHVDALSAQTPSAYYPAIQIVNVDSAGGDQQPLPVSSKLCLLGTFPGPLEGMLWVCMLA